MLNTGFPTYLHQGRIFLNIGKRKNLDRRKTLCGKKKTPIYEPTEKEKAKYRTTLLSGEKCSGCKKRRTAVLVSTKNMRAKIEQYQ